MVKKITLREQKKSRNRHLLLTATANIIAAEGMGDTSITRIIEQAGLSRGMVHLHFGNKEALLIAVASYMSQVYFSHLKEFLNAALPQPQYQLEAIVKADLSDQILNRHNVNIWYAFRGQCHQEKAYMEYADTRDAAMKDQVYHAFLQLSGNQNNVQNLARDATHGTLALLEGMWSDYFLHSDQFNRESARRIVFRFLSGLYPQHFDCSGAIN